MKVTLIILIALVINWSAVSASALKIALANPASVNCEEEGGKIEMRKTSQGDEYAVCVWKCECGEWALFRGECKACTCAKWHAFYDSDGKLISKCVKKFGK